MRGELSAHVVVSRGRLGVYAADTFDELGRGDAGTDWLAAQEPGIDLLLLGLPDRDGHPLPGRGQRRRRRGAGRHPGGHQGLRVPARGPRRRDRAARLGDPGPAQRDPRRGGAGRRASGSRSRPPIRVTATLRSFVDGDVSHSVPLPEVTERRPQAILPDGPRDRAALLRRRRLGRGAGPARGRRQEGGRRRPRPRAGPPRSGCPPRAVLVQVTPRGTDLRGAVVVAGRRSGRARPARPGAHRAGAGRATRPAVADRALVDGVVHRVRPRPGHRPGNRPPGRPRGASGPSSGPAASLGSRPARPRHCAGRRCCPSGRDDRHCRRPGALRRAGAGHRHRDRRAVARPARSVEYAVEDAPQIPDDWDVGDGPALVADPRHRRQPHAAGALPAAHRAPQRDPCGPRGAGADGRGGAGRGAAGDRALDRGSALGPNAADRSRRVGGRRQRA